MNYNNPDTPVVHRPRFEIIKIDVHQDLVDDIKYDTVSGTSVGAAVIQANNLEVIEELFNSIPVL